MRSRETITHFICDNCGVEEIKSSKSPAWGDEVKIHSLPRGWMSVTNGEGTREFCPKHQLVSADSLPKKLYNLNVKTNKQEKKNE